jgi:putative nucleotidyltransferase with HDIG domain
MGQLAEVLALDTALAGLVLRWANSAYYSPRLPIATVRQAVVYLGQNTLQSLVLAASVAAFLDRPAPGYGLERGELWKHSVTVAAGARLIALKYGAPMAEEAYHAGLLADMGKLAFERVLRGIDTRTPEWQDQSFADLERLHFGIDHASLGAEMARRWQFPPALIDAIANHHHPSQAREGSILAAAVHVADVATMLLGVGLGRDGLQYGLDPAACERVGWTEADLPVLLDRVRPFIAEADTFVRLHRA